MTPKQAFEALKLVYQENNQLNSGTDIYYVMYKKFTLFTCITVLENFHYIFFFLFFEYLLKVYFHSADIIRAPVKLHY